MGGNIPGGNFLGGAFPEGIFQRGVWWVGIFLEPWEGKSRFSQYQRHCNSHIPSTKSAFDTDPEHASTN